jgi:hypothetical protein
LAQLHLEPRGARGLVELGVGEVLDLRRECYVAGQDRLRHACGVEAVGELHRRALGVWPRGRPRDRARLAQCVGELAPAASLGEEELDSAEHDAHLRPRADRVNRIGKPRGDVAHQLALEVEPRVADGIGRIGQDRAEQLFARAPHAASARRH